MASKMLWELSMLDRMSGPAMRASTAMDGLAKSIKAIQRMGRVKLPGATGSGDAFSAMASGLSSMATHGAGVATAMGAIGAAAAAATVGIAAITASLGSAVAESAVFRENTLATLEIFSGSRASAQRLYGQGQRFAAATPFSSREVGGAQSRLLSQGFTEQELPSLIGFVSDLASITGDHNVIGQITQQLGQVNSLGRLQFIDLKQISQAGNLRLNGDQGVYAQIARMMNLGTGAGGIRAAQSAVSSGRVDSQTGIRAMMDTLAAQQGGAIGTSSNRFAGTLAGLFSTMSDIPSSMMENLRFEDMPGIRTLKTGMESIIRLMDASGPRARRLSTALETLVSGSLSRLFAGFSDQTAEQWLDGAISRFESLVPVALNAVTNIRALGEGFMAGLAPALAIVSQHMRAIGGANAAASMRSFGESVGSSLGLVIELGQALGAIVSALQTIGGVLGQGTELFLTGSGFDTSRMLEGNGQAVVNFRGMGTQLAAGMAAGIADGTPAVQTASSAMVTSAAAAAATAGQIQSPSQLFAGLGWYLGAGLAEGMDASGDEVAKAGDAMIGAALPAGGLAGMGGAGAGASIHIEHLELHGFEDPKEAARAFVAEVFEQLAPELG